MPARQSEAIWEGNLKQGRGTIKLGSGAFQGRYSFDTRFENGTGTNPEELIAAAHSGCYSMALAHALTEAGHSPTRIHTTAKVYLQKNPDGFSIPQIDLVTEAEVPGLDDHDFQQVAEEAKKNCPVSKLLAGAEIMLDAKLTDTATSRT